MRADPLSTMTVRELIEELESQDPDARVVFQYDYGDYGHTQAIGEIGLVEVRPVEPSGYSRSGWAIKEDDDEPEEDRECTRCGDIKDEHAPADNHAFTLEPDPDEEPLLTYVVLTRY